MRELAWDLLQQNATTFAIVVVQVALMANITTWGVFGYRATAVETASVAGFFVGDANMAITVGCQSRATAAAICLLNCYSGRASANVVRCCCCGFDATGADRDFSSCCGSSIVNCL